MHPYSLQQEGTFILAAYISYSLAPYATKKYKHSTFEDPYFSLNQGPTNWTHTSKPPNLINSPAPLHIRGDTASSDRESSRDHLRSSGSTVGVAVHQLWRVDVESRLGGAKDTANIPLSPTLFGPFSVFLSFSFISKILSAILRYQAETKQAALRLHWHQQ